MKVKILIFFIVVVLIITFSVLRNKNIDNNREDYINNLDLIFTGIVVGIDSIQQNGGIVSINIKKSNKIIHDVRDETDYYLCTLKEGKAELLVLFIEKFDVNDSICFDGRRKNVFIYKKEKVLDSIKMEKLMMRGGPLHDQARSGQKL